MPDTPMPLRHSETPGSEDTALAQAARAHVANNRVPQLIAELLAKLRGARFSWWTAEQLRGAWGAGERMRWLRERPDIRQRITCELTGLKPKAARNKQPEFQAGLIDSVIDDGDVAVDQFENAFDTMELAAYAPAAAVWQRFRERMPWDQDVAANQDLAAWLLDRLLASFSTLDGMKREPILTPYALRTAIAGKTWHTKIPLDVRVALDELRFEHERSKPGEPFHAVHELAVATPAIIAANIPLRELLGVLDAAEKAMGLSSAPGAAQARAAEPARVEAPKVEAPRVDAKVQPAPAPVEKALEKLAEPVKAEPPRVEVKPQTPAPPAEKAPEKPAEKAAERNADRWERMASRVLERVGKESSNADNPGGAAVKK